MKSLSIYLSKSYPIYIGQNLLNSSALLHCCITLNKRIVIITDSHLVNSLGKSLQKIFYNNGVNAELLKFTAGEINKTRKTKQQLENKLLQKKIGRDTCLIALGGGVVTDLVGFLAATYCRGLPVIYIPTTLLAMVDASIGGKTGVNTSHGKNLIGTFTQPHAVFMDIDTLNSLPQKEWRNGMAEMIKHSIIADSAIFKLLQENSHKIKQRNANFLIEMIFASCLIKKNIVEQDEHEQGIRQLLNFGHTIGHAIEAIEKYNISHGEAIAIGMLVESYLSVQSGYLQKIHVNTLYEILHSYDLPLRTSAFQNITMFQKTLLLDKKSVKNIPQFVMLNSIGNPHSQFGCYTMPVNSVHLIQALNWANHYFSGAIC